MIPKLNKWRKKIGTCKRNSTAPFVVIWGQKSYIINLAVSTVGWIMAQMIVLVNKGVDQKFKALNVHVNTAKK
mgnify:CR=1 FL=1